MDLASLLFVAALILIVPLALFVGLVGLGILIWSWKRIGPYFVSFGRWVADWRNIVPLGCLGMLTIILMVLFAAVLPPELDILRIAILGLVILFGVVFTIVALAVWTVRLVAWVWPRFRREFWRSLQRVWDLVGKGMSGERRAKVAAGGQKMAQKTARSRQTPGQPDGAAPTDVRPAVGRVPPSKRSWLDFSWLWALVWGRPQKPAKGPKLMAKSPEAHAQTAAEPTTPARVPAKPKAGLRPLLWRLGLVVPWLQGKPRGPGGKPKPGASKRMAETPNKPITPAAPMASQPRPTVTVPAAKAPDTKPKPKRRVRGAIRGIGRSMVAAVEALRKGFWLGIFWVLGKARAGMDYILRLLHLGGRRR